MPTARSGKRKFSLGSQILTYIIGSVPERNQRFQLRNAVNRMNEANGTIPIG